MDFAELLFMLIQKNTQMAEMDQISMGMGQKNQFYVGVVTEVCESPVEFESLGCVLVCEMQCFRDD